MKQPLLFRKTIPFFYNKSEKEFRNDPYEQYDPMVIRQSALHLIDDMWGGYPMQLILDFADKNWPDQDVKDVVEIGCGVGRWIGGIAEKFPNSKCWGIDYSYQLLKRAEEAWIKGAPIQLNLSKYGFSHSHQIQGKTLSNLQLGLAKAESLPFDDESQDVVLSSFLFDRLEDPILGLQEMKRIVRPKGKIILVSPLNFLKAQHWEQFHPPIKLYQLLKKMGLEIIDWVEELKTIEPLDVRGNEIAWKSLGVVCRKATFKLSLIKCQ